MGQTGGVTGVDDVRSQPRTILHADMDAFFVSVELRRRPELVGQPVVVGGTGARGVVAAASYEARRYGVRSAMPSSVARRRCPHAVFLPAITSCTRQVSRDVREIFDRYTPIVEPLSLDEAFLDVTGCGDAVRRRHHHRPFASAMRSRRTRRSAVRSASPATSSSPSWPRSRRSRSPTPIGSSRVRASWSSSRATSRSSSIDSRCRALWGVGPVTLDKLHRLGVTRVRDLARRSTTACSSRRLGPRRPAISRRWRSGTTTARSSPIVWRSRSATRRRSPPTSSPRPSCNASSCASPTASPCGSGRPSVGARTITLKVRFAGFHTITRSTTTADALDLARPILAAVAPAAARRSTPRPGVRLLGVSGSNLGTAAAPVELRRSTTRRRVPPSRPDWASATDAMDAIRERFGASAIGPASALEGGDSGSCARAPSSGVRIRSPRCG